MKIVALVKQVPDTWGKRTLDTTTGLLERDSSDRVIDDVVERAVEVALSIKDADKSVEVVVVSMGPTEAHDMLRKTLAMGADSAVHITDDALAGSDLAATAAVLVAALGRLGADLIVTGNESTDGRGGVIPSMLAEMLSLPLVAGVDSVELGSGMVSGPRESEWGSAQVSAELPAVVSVTERAPEARFPGFKGIMTAKKKPLLVWSAAELGEGFLSSTAVVSVQQRPARLAGRTIIDSGNAGVELADYLASERLI